MIKNCRLISLCFAFSLMMGGLTVQAQVNSLESSTSNNLSNQITNKLISKKWYSGVEDCSTNSASAIEVYQHDQNSYILRQNKCTHYEAPFIYLLFGDEKALIIDTGATEDEAIFPLAKIVHQIIAQRQGQMKQTANNIELIIAHSHSHSDHIAGDKQFEKIIYSKDKAKGYNKFSATEMTHIVVPKNLDALMSAFSIKRWPEQIANINLGNRLINIIPTPGHQKEAITLYEHQTQWLLTGDSLYPGRLYIRQWLVFKESIHRLAKFSQKHEISAILGAHIEMSSLPGKDYKMGTTFHPNEASLVLKAEDLMILENTLNEMGNSPKRAILDKFIIYPVK